MTLGAASFLVFLVGVPSSSAAAEMPLRLRLPVEVPLALGVFLVAWVAGPTVAATPSHRSCSASFLSL
jgi:hypothetical protein